MVEYTDISGALKTIEKNLKKDNAQPFLFYFRRIILNYSPKILSIFIS